MKTFSSVVIATLTMVGMASAQPKTEPKPAAAAAPAAKVDAKATGKVVAPAKVDAPPTGKDAAPAKAPTEIADMLKSMSGNWKCTGTAAGPDMAMMPMKATMKSKADLDGYWIQDVFEATMGKTKYKFVAYTTFDTSSKKWRRVSVDNGGSQTIGTSDGMKDMKMTFNLDTMGGSHPSGMFRDNVDASDLKTGLKAFGEVSIDKGKTWMKVYEMTCKK
jgi:hypothetical protein